MAIVISGVNNNDKITATDGTIDLLSGVNYSSEVEVPSLKVGNNIQFGNAGIVTATSFAGNISGTTGTFGDFVNIGSNIQLGNAGVVTATTFVGNVTGNVNNTGNLLFQIGGSEKVRIHSGGQVQIAGDSIASISSFADDLIIGESGSSAISGLTFCSTDSSGIRFHDTADMGEIEFDHSDNSLAIKANQILKFRTNNAERLRIDNQGSVMINGTTSFGGGNTKLQVRGASSGLSDGAQIFDIASTAAANGGTRLAFGVNEDNFGWIRSYESGVGGRDIVLAASDEKMRIKTDGKIGIGITNPQKNLHLYSSGVVSLRIETSDSRGQAWDILSTNGAQNNTGTLSFRDESGSAYLEFGANEGSPQFRVRNGGANDLLHIDNNGTVTKSKHPIFATRINYVNSYVSSGTKIQMRAAHIDTRSGFSDANDRYTAPAAGRYLFYFFSNIDYNGDGTIAVRFYKNGSEFTGTEGGHIYGYAQNSGWHNLCGQIITTMAVNDYMEVFTAANNMKVDGNNYGQFGGYMIG